MSFGKRLKEARVLRNMTQEALAEAAGVTKGAIGNYEAEISSPKETILITLMKILDVDANFLYQDYISQKHSLSSDEQRLISLWRNAEDVAKDIAFDALKNHQKKSAASEPSAI